MYWGNVNMPLINENIRWQTNLKAGNVPEYCYLCEMLCKNLPFNPKNIYLFKVINRNFGKRCEVCSKLTIKIPEWRQWRHSGVFIVNLKHFTPLSTIVDFEQVNVSHFWDSWIDGGL